METVIRHVRDLGASERSALEQLVGHTLHENQQLVIQVMTFNVPAAGAPRPAGATLPDWCKVFEGLTDEEIAAVESVALQRANLTRSS